MIVVEEVRTLIIEPLMVCWYQFYSGLRMVGSGPTLSTAHATRMIAGTDDLPMAHGAPHRARPIVRHAAGRAAPASSRTILALVPSTRRPARRS
jgi:hypothetical protein